MDLPVDVSVMQLSNLRQANLGFCIKQLTAIQIRENRSIAAECLNDVCVFVLEKIVGSGRQRLN